MNYIRRTHSSLGCAHCTSHTNISLVQSPAIAHCNAEYLEIFCFFHFFFFKHFIGFSICNHKMRRSLLKKRPQEFHQQNKTTMEHQNTRALAWNCCFSLISKCCTKWDSGTDEFSPSGGTKRAPTPWVQPADRSNLLAEEPIKSLVPELHVPAKTFQMF